MIAKYLAVLLCACAVYSAHLPLDTKEKTDEGFKRYTVDALEGGKIVHEEILIDLQEGLEAIDMPAHNGLDAVLTINDFKKKWTVRAMTEKETCYVMPLDDDVFDEPAVMSHAMESGIEGVWINTKNISYTYTVLGRVITANLDFLPVAAQEVCQDWPVYYVQLVEEQAYTANKHGVQVKNVKPIGSVPDNKRTKRGIDTCPYDFVQSACKFINRFCHYIKTCKIEYNPATQQDQVKCGEKQHKFGKNECCRRCCSDRDFSGLTTPFCGELTENDIDCANPIKEVMAP